MQSKIVFLGTGGDSFVISKNIRSSGGVIIQVDDYQFHLDPGPGSLVKASEFGINLRENTALLVSSPSIFNSNDINAVISAMTYDGVDKKGVLICANKVINGDDKEHPRITNLHRNCIERFIAVSENQKIGIEDIEIHVLETTNKDCVGFKFLTPNFVLSYSSNTGYTNDIAKQYEQSDILILNVPNPSNVKSETALSSDDVVKIIEKVKPRLAILTHFGKKMMEVDPMYEARQVKLKTNIQTLSATDGLAINPLSYSANLRQRTLNLYPKDEQPITENKETTEQPAIEETEEKHDDSTSTQSTLAQQTQ